MAALGPLMRAPAAERLGRAKLAIGLVHRAGTFNSREIPRAEVAGHRSPLPMEVDIIKAASNLGIGIAPIAGTYSFHLVRAAASAAHQGRMMHIIWQVDVEAVVAADTMDLVAMDRKSVIGIAQVVVICSFRRVRLADCVRPRSQQRVSSADAEEQGVGQEVAAFRVNRAIGIVQTAGICNSRHVSCAEGVARTSQRAFLLFRHSSRLNHLRQPQRLRRAQGPVEVHMGTVDLGSGIVQTVVICSSHSVLIVGDVAPPNPQKVTAAPRIKADLVIGTVRIVGICNLRRD